MADKRDYYDILGVERNASPDELKKAYRAKARQLHPDVNQSDPHAEEQFKELGEAYDVLNDANKRAVYDRYGHAGMQGGGGGGGGGNGGSPFGDFGFSDLFESFFSGGAGQNGRPDPTGATLRYDLQVTLEEAAKGTERTIRVPHQTPCHTCNSSGTTERGGAVPCPACAGTGQRRQTSASLFGMQFSSVAPCDRCGATGEIISNPCQACNGSGRVRTTEEIVVTVPPGVDTGARIRYRGKGDAGLRGAGAGDLMVAIHIAPHAVFQRQGLELAREVSLPYATAALGGKLLVTTLIDGDETIDIPPGTQPGAMFRLRGKGMPDLHTSRRGDLHVQVQIAVPTDLSAHQRDLLREFARERGENIDHTKKNVFQRVKEAVEDVVEDLGGKAHDTFNG